MFSFKPSSGKDYKQEAKDLRMVRHGKPRNTKIWEQFDTSIFTKDDIVLLIDGDWAVFSATSKEMERYIEVELGGLNLRFEGYRGMEAYCVANEIPYEPRLAVKHQSNHENAVNYAKATIKKKVAKAIEQTGATQVVFFCGSSGNHRDYLPLPNIDDEHFYNYKGQRETEWIPETLPEVKEWVLGSWLSHWSVGEEADDSITIAKKSLDQRGIKTFLMGVDKDFCGEQIGGLYIIGHHEEPVYYEDTPENRLGWIEATKTAGGSDKMKGHGDMFLAYQILTEDVADNYSAKKFCGKYGTLKRFGFKACEKYLMQAQSQQELWQLVVDHFKAYLPEKYEYTDCFGAKHVDQTPLDALKLYYRCAKMREYKDHRPDVVEDRLKPLGVNYE